MGQTCCPDNPRPTADDVTNNGVERPQKQPKETKKKKEKDNEAVVDYESGSSDDDEDDYGPSTQEDEPPENSENDKESSYSGSHAVNRAIDGFKNAINIGNDSLVMYYVKEHPRLDLLDTKFSNGDGVLHIAVRKSHINLIIYLLSQDVSVTNITIFVYTFTQIQCARMSYMK